MPAGSGDLDILDAGRGTPDDLHAIDDRIRGKAVLVEHEYMFAADHMHRMKKFEAARQLGAAALIVINPDPTSGFVALDQMVRKAATKTGITVQTYAPLLKNSDHYNFAAKGIPALRLIAGFGEPDSKLKCVLTEADDRGLCDAEEIRVAISLVRKMVYLSRNEMARM